MPARLAPKARFFAAVWTGTLMLSFFRRVTNSKIGTWIMAAILLAILAGFGLADLSNFGTGNIGFGGMGGTTLARVGDQEVGEREVNEAMQRRLQDVRQQNPVADYATIARDFDPLLEAMIDQRSLIAFADKFGFHLSKALIDAEIAQLPQVKGLNGKVSDQAYQTFLQQQKMTDAQVRDIITAGLLQRLTLTPVASNARLSVGMATPYASMMLEARQGDGVAIPLEPFKTGVKPTEAQVQQFYAANRGRYIVPEQRVLRFAAVVPEQFANIAASDQEIAAEYARNQATYGAKETRGLSQAVVPDQATANAIAQRAKSGATLAAAAAPAGANAAVTSLSGQSRQAYAGVAGDKVASAVFAAPSGTVVGPLQSDFGWVVVKVDSVKTEGDKSLAQARAEIAAKLTADKRKAALEDMVDKLNDAVDAGHNFTEAAAEARVPVTSTPLINAGGTAPADPSFRLSPDYAPVLKSGFETAPSDPPEIVALASKQGYVMVSPTQVVPAAPAPLAKIHDQVATDWVNDQARRRAAALATSIAAKASSGMSLAEAIKSAGIALPPVQPIAARRIQIASQNGQVPAPLRLLFTLAQGKSRMLADPGGRGFYVVKTNSIVPGNALLQPGLINRMQTELQESVSQEYAQQFQAAVRAEMKAKRNESAIAAEKARLVSSGG
ncbi:MAG: peptidyl-prolyl cis-trans isomerase [Sphingomonadales bacterium]|nr:peptidyl-prolyl cis-trans isomerase [Sphingomonadales bacterium]